MPAARALSSTSGEAAEDNVEEREKRYGLQVTYGRTYLRTDVRTYGQRDMSVEILV